MNYGKVIKKPRTGLKKPSKKPNRPKGAGGVKTVKGKAALPRGNKRGK